MANNFVIMGDDGEGNATVRMFVNGQPYDEIFQYVVPVSAENQLTPIVNTRMTALAAAPPATSVDTPTIETPETLTPTVADEEVATDPANIGAKPAS